MVIRSVFAERDGIRPFCIGIGDMDVTHQLATESISNRQSARPGSDRLLLAMRNLHHSQFGSLSFLPEHAYLTVSVQIYFLAVDQNKAQLAGLPVIMQAIAVRT